MKPLLPALLVALHPEGVDRNIDQMKARGYGVVALHPEGVDRNDYGKPRMDREADVALHPEGVDRNLYADERGA